jgi:DNA-directed RNA polymerase subunit M/transcription elongation factor TFIIS
MEDVALQLGIDVDRRTTRGRVCPRCGGKIIPSRRAVYQSTGDPSEVFPAWQCERCGYEELVARPVKATPKHGAAAKPAEKKPSAVTSSATETSGAVASPKAPAMRAAPSMKDRKGRELPADVVRMLTEMNKEVGGKQ